MYSHNCNDVWDQQIINLSAQSNMPNDTAGKAKVMNKVLDTWAGNAKNIISPGQIAEAQILHVAYMYVYVCMKIASITNQTPGPAYMHVLQSQIIIYQTWALVGCFLWRLSMT